MSRTAKAIAAAAIFALLGPLVGGLVVGAMTVLGALAGAVSGVDGWGSNFESALNLLPVIAMFAYLLGGIPALLSSGWIAWNVVRERSVSTGAAAIAGAVASLPLGLFLVSNDALNVLTAPKTLMTLGWYCLLGACSAVVCLWLCRRIGLVLAPTPA